MVWRFAPHYHFPKNRNHQIGGVNPEPIAAKMLKHCIVKILIISLYILLHFLLNP